MSTLNIHCFKVYERHINVLNHIFGSWLDQSRWNQLWNTNTCCLPHTANTMNILLHQKNISADMLRQAGTLFHWEWIPTAQFIATLQFWWQKIHSKIIFSKRDFSWDNLEIVDRWSTRIPPPRTRTFEQPVWPWPMTYWPEWVIKFNGLFGDTGHWGPCSPYKPCNHSLYIGIIIFPHTDNTYRQVTNIRRTLVGNKIVDNSDVVGASPVGAAPTTSSLST